MGGFNTWLLLDKYLQNQCAQQEAVQVLEWLTAEYDYEHRLWLHYLLLRNSMPGSPDPVEQNNCIHQNFENIMSKINAASYRQRCPFIKRITSLKYG